MTHRNDTVTVAHYQYRFQAEHVLGFLRQNSVDAILWGDDVGGLNPAIGFLETFEIRVHPDQAELARELLHDFGMAGRTESTADSAPADDADPPAPTD